MSSNEIGNWQIIFFGKVQGVGFRWTVVDHAEKLNLKGTVKNLANGSVEAIVNGSKEECEKLINSLQKNSFPAVIEKLEIHKLPKNKEIFLNFKVI